MMVGIHREAEPNSQLYHADRGGLCLFLARDVIYTSYATMSLQCPSVCLSVRLFVTEVHCGHGACREERRGHLALC